MSQPNESESKLLVELSEQEQETVVGGFDLGDLFGFFFFDQTEIDTSASHAVSFSQKNSNFSSSSNTDYKLRRTTLAFGSPRSGSSSRSSSSMSRRGFSSITKILRRLFSEW